MADNILADVANKKSALKEAADATDEGVKKKAVAVKRTQDQAAADDGPTMLPGEKVGDYMARVKAWASGK